MKPLKYIFIICFADFCSSVVTYLGPDSRPPGPGDPINSSLQGEDPWGFVGGGRGLRLLRRSCEVASVTSCHLGFPQPMGRMSEHSTFDFPKHSFFQVPQRKARNVFWMAARRQRRLGRTCGRRGEPATRVPAKNPIPSAFSVPQYEKGVELCSRRGWLFSCYVFLLFCLTEPDKLSLLSSL